MPPQPDPVEDRAQDHQGQHQESRRAPHQSVNELRNVDCGPTREVRAQTQDLKGSCPYRPDPPGMKGQNSKSDGPDRIGNQGRRVDAGETAGDKCNADPLEHRHRDDDQDAVSLRCAAFPDRQHKRERQQQEKGKSLVFSQTGCSVTPQATARSRPPPSAPIFLSGHS